MLLQGAKCQLLFFQRRSAPLAHAHMTVTVLFMAHADWPVAGAAHQHDVADGNRTFLLGDAALDVALRIGAHVLFHHHHVLHQHLALVGHNAQYAALFALVAPGNHPHLIVAANVYTFLHLYPLSTSRLPRLKNFRRQGNNLQEFLLAQFARHGTEHTRPDWLVHIVDQHRRVLVEAYVGAIAAAMLLASTHDHRLDHRAFLGGAVGRCFFNRGGHDVAQSGNQTGGTAQRQNHLQLARAGVVGHLEHASHHHCHSRISLLLVRLSSPVAPRLAPLAPRGAQFPSTASASTSTADASLQSSQNHRDAPCPARHAHRTSCCATPRVCRTGVPSAAALRPRWSWPSWWKPLHRSGSCGGLRRLFRWLSSFPP